MQGDRHNLPRNQDQMGNNGYLPDHRISSFFGQNVDFHPSRDCPRNFIIFDRTDNHSQVMYNPGLNMGRPYFPDTELMQKDVYAPRAVEEDQADIDALLSFDDEDEDEEYEEEEEVSTGRTYGNDTCDTSDSCSSMLRNKWAGSTSSHGSKSSSGKHEKMKMMKSIRGIVPGGNPQMNTVEVLDEAVKYLKSLKVEACKMGFGNLSG
ncbi:transcription factor bHLH144-like [Bidens hawaiensis]|uniref:transcription factor bHLH144-like n=1 Tax=Bidens hawaiensis TaxID=980011 RepID=UPI00404A9966